MSTVDPFSKLQGNLSGINNICIFIFTKKFCGWLGFTFSVSKFNNIARFYISGFPIILEKILGYLDDKDLRNVQQVCKQWNERVNDGNFWRTQLQQKVSTNNL